MTFSADDIKSLVPKLSECRYLLEAVPSNVSKACALWEVYLTGIALGFSAVFSLDIRWYRMAAGFRIKSYRPVFDGYAVNSRYSDTDPVKLHCPHVEAKVIEHPLTVSLERYLSDVLGFTHTLRRIGWGWDEVEAFCNKRCKVRQGGLAHRILKDDASGMYAPQIYCSVFGGRLDVVCDLFRYGTDGDAVTAGPGWYDAVYGDGRTRLSQVVDPCNAASALTFIWPKGVRQEDINRYFISA